MSEQLRYFVVEVTRSPEAATNEHVQAQREFLEKLTEQGVLVISGPLSDTPNRGIGILKAVDLSAAQRIYAAAPLIAKGIAVFKIHPLEAAYGTILNA